jgi:predicted enzyme related to lactoylglutathione lyase
VSLIQVAQRADDLTRAAEFYAAVLGSPPLAVYDPPGLVFFDLGGGTRLLLERGAPSSLVYLRVDDLEAAIARAREAGGAVMTEPHVIFSHADDVLGPAGHDEWHAFVTDTERNTVGLVELRRSS